MASKQTEELNTHGFYTTKTQTGSSGVNMARAAAGIIAGFLSCYGFTARDAMSKELPRVVSVVSGKHKARASEWCVIGS